MLSVTCGIEGETKKRLRNESLEPLNVIAPIGEHRALEQLGTAIGSAATLQVSLCHAEMPKSNSATTIALILYSFRTKTPT